MMKPIMLTLALIAGAALAVQAQSSSVVGSWKAEVPTSEEGQMVPLKVTMTADGTYSVDFGMDGIVEIKGNYEIDGDQITVQDTFSENLCSGKGVYRFSIDQKTLTMIRVSDECEGRGGPEGKMVMTKM